MARHSRQTTEYIHIIVRGIGKQMLFEDDFDRKHYLNLLKKYRDEFDVTIIAYCLMDNHVHLLIFDPNGSVTDFMKRIGICYAQYFNKKYERTGHLFQDRYKSENITDQAYFLTVYRYILKNPEKAGICNASAYPWSSYREYGKSDQITNTTVLHEMLGQKVFEEYISTDDPMECMEYESERYNDAYAIKVIHEDMNLRSGTLLQGMAKSERNALIVAMKEKGLSCRQIVRLTGIGMGVVAKIH